MRAEIKALTDRAAAEEKEDGDYKRAAKDAMRLSGTVEFGACAAERARPRRTEFDSAAAQRVASRRRSTPTDTHSRWLWRAP